MEFFMGYVVIGAIVSGSFLAVHARAHPDISLRAIDAVLLAAIWPVTAFLIVADLFRIADRS